MSRFLLAARATAALATNASLTSQANDICTALHRAPGGLTNTTDNIRTALQGLTKSTDQRHWFYYSR
jgi:hypothetical protein